MFQLFHNFLFYAYSKCVCTWFCYKLSLKKLKYIHFQVLVQTFDWKCIRTYITNILFCVCCLYKSQWWLISSPTASPAAPACVPSQPASGQWCSAAPGWKWSPLCWGTTQLRSAGSEGSPFAPVSVAPVWLMAERLKGCSWKATFDPTLTMFRNHFKGVRELTFSDVRWILLQWNFSLSEPHYQK